MSLDGKGEEHTNRSGCVSQPSLSHIESLLFSQRVQPPSSSSCTDTHKRCIIIQRLVICLQYFANCNNTGMHQIFNDFMDKTYKHKVYDDYYHLTKYHQHELESIMQSAIESRRFIKCDLSICNFANRHFRVKSDKSVAINHENQKYCDIYTQTMDSLHYYLFHLTETGMRPAHASMIQSNIDPQEEKENPSSSQHFDSSFQRVCNAINRCRDKTNRFTRITGNKFNISVVESEVTGDDTFLDAVYSEIAPIDSDHSVFLVREIIEANGYDTDSLDLDFQMFMNDKKSNLSQLLHDHMDKHNRILTLLKKYSS